MENSEFYIEINNTILFCPDILTAERKYDEVLLTCNNGTEIILSDAKYLDEILDKKANFHKLQNIVNVDKTILDIEEKVKQKSLANIQEIEDKFKSSLAQTESKIDSIRQTISTIDPSRAVSLVDDMETLLSKFKALI